MIDIDGDLYRSISEFFKFTFSSVTIYIAVSRSGSQMPTNVSCIWFLMFVSK